MTFRIFASLTPTDGSFFVTKGEFDSAIIDLGARISAFEALTNTKIDTQVDSYLKENGIWSGKNQNILKEHLVFTYGTAVGTNLNYKDGKTISVDLKGFSNLPTLSSGLSYVIRNNLYTLTENINKTGLCCLRYEIKSNATNLQDSYFATTTNKNSWRYKMDSSKSPNNVCSWDPNIYLYQPVNYLIGNRDISLSCGSFRPYMVTYYVDRDNAVNGYYYSCQPYDSAGCLYFFVKGGIPLYFEEYLSLTLHSDNSAKSLSGQSPQNIGNNYVGYRVDFTSIVVY